MPRTSSCTAKAGPRSWQSIVATANALHREPRGEVENDLGIDAARLSAAYDYLAARRPAFDEAIGKFDAWLTPAVPGVAPRGLDSTGEATFNRLWTGLHVPAITLPGYTTDGRATCRRSTRRAAIL